MLILDSTTSHAEDTNPSATLHAATLHEVHVAFILQNMWDWKYELQENKLHEFHPRRLVLTLVE
jgi:hypothetical protein